MRMMSGSRRKQEPWRKRMLITFPLAWRDWTNIGRWKQKITCAHLSSTTAGKGGRRRTSLKQPRVTWWRTRTTYCSTANALLFPKHSRKKSSKWSMKDTREQRGVNFTPTFPFGGQDSLQKSRPWWHRVHNEPETYTLCFPPPRS